MKKLIGILVVWIIAGLLSIGRVQAWDTGGKDYVTVATPLSYTNGTSYSTVANRYAGTNGFDLTAYNGFGKLIVFVSANQSTDGQSVTNTDAIFLEHATYATGTYAEVSLPGMPSLQATSQVAKVDVDLETLKNFVRLGVKSYCAVGSNASHSVGAVLVCPSKND